MKPYLRLITAAALIILPATAFAQADPHHPDADAGAPSAPTVIPSPAPSATPAPAPMTSDQPGQPAAMMQMMQQMMPMMQQMMQMMQGEMMGGGMGAMSTPGSMSEASKAYMEAMKKMDAPMMTALQSGDPDVAFVSAMIPHHQGAIDMARAVLTHGKDEKVKAWAEQIIKAQEAEIAEMQAWLKEHAQ